MKVAVIFFLSVFFHVFSGHDAASASVRHGNIRLAAHNIKKTQQVESAKTNEGSLLSKDADSNEQNDYVLTARDEDEDIIRKHLLPAAHFSALVYAFVSIYLQNCLSGKLSFYKSPSYTGSCKYIAQRALRL
jgi:hypothetical protein